MPALSRFEEYPLEALQFFAGTFDGGRPLAHIELRHRGAGATAGVLDIEADPEAALLSRLNLEIAIAKSRVGEAKSEGKHGVGVGVLIAPIADKDAFAIDDLVRARLRIVTVVARIVGDLPLPADRQVARWIGFSEKQAGQGGPALFAGVPGLKDRLHIVLPSREVHAAACSENHDGLFPERRNRLDQLFLSHGKFKATVPALRFRGIVEADAQDHGIGLFRDRKGHRIDHGGNRSDADAQAGNASDLLGKLLEHHFMGCFGQWHGDLAEDVLGHLGAVEHHLVIDEQAEPSVGLGEYRIVPILLGGVVGGPATGVSEDLVGGGAAASGQGIQFLLFRLAASRTGGDHGRLDGRALDPARQTDLGEEFVGHAANGACRIGREVGEPRHLVHAVDSARIKNARLPAQIVGDAGERAGGREADDLAAAAPGGDGLGCGWPDDRDSV